MKDLFSCPKSSLQLPRIGGDSSKCKKMKQYSIQKEIKVQKQIIPLMLYSHIYKVSSKHYLIFFILINISLFEGELQNEQGGHHNFPELLGRGVGQVVVGGRGLIGASLKNRKVELTRKIITFAHTNICTNTAEVAVTFQLKCKI